MLKDCVTILDIGSSKITAMRGKRGVNNTFNIEAMSEAEYDGYSGGEFLDYQGLKNAIITVVNGIIKNTRTAIEKLYVGVPGEFLRVINKRQQMSFGKSKRISSKEIEELNKIAFSTCETVGTIIDISAVFYVLDGNRKVFNPEGLKTTVLDGQLVGYECVNSFISTVKEIALGLNVKAVEFVPAQLAEAQFLFSSEERSHYRVLLDVGYISSTYSLVYGNAIIYQKSFSLGGGYITAYLMNRFGIEDIKDAEKLKRKVNLASASCNYEIVVGEEIMTFTSREVHPVVLDVMSMIAENVCKCMEESEKITKEPIDISLTGGGISYMRGARDYLVSRTEVNVEMVCPSVPYMNKPSESSRFGLLDYALNKKQKNKLLFF